MMEKKNQLKISIAFYFLILIYSDKENKISEWIVFDPPITYDN